MPSIRTHWSRFAIVAAGIWTCISMLPAASSEQCLACHPDQVRGYAKTGMANSIGKPSGQPGGRFRAGASGARIEIKSGSSGMTHRLERDGLTAEHEVSFFIGSGSKGRSYVISAGGRLFQSPASYYSARKTWDLSPGFEGEHDLDFDRPIPPECLFCHAGRPRPIPFTLNSYESPAVESMSITCARCHGPTEAHLARPAKSNIVNPARLEPRRRDAVCEQCHLGGEARIPNPTHQTWDYRPGQLLEDVLTVYVFDRSTADEPLKVVSHSEQLAASKCAQKSGTRMWCGTCHDPHDEPAQPAAYFNARCHQCHSSASLSKHTKPAENCTGCHMPQRTVYDGGHTAFTDHRIRSNPRSTDVSKPLPSKLRPWREPDAALARRNLGLAYISVGERYQSAEHLNEGFRHLASVQTSFANDPAVLTSLGAVLQRKRVPREALRLFLRASELEPKDARHRLNLAIALMEAGEVDRAISALQSAITLDQSLRDAYVLLAESYERSGEAAKRRQILMKYLEVMPQSIVVRKLVP